MILPQHLVIISKFHLIKKESIFCNKVVILNQKVIILRRKKHFGVAKVDTFEIFYDYVKVVVCVVVLCQKVDFQSSPVKKYNKILTK